MPERKALQSCRDLHITMYELCEAGGSMEESGGWRWTRDGRDERKSPFMGSAVEFCPSRSPPSPPDAALPKWEVSLLDGETSTPSWATGRQDASKAFYSAQFAHSIFSTLGEVSLASTDADAIFPPRPGHPKLCVNASLLSRHDPSNWPRALYMTPLSPLSKAEHSFCLCESGTRLLLRSITFTTLFIIREVFANSARVRRQVSISKISTSSTDMHTGPHYTPQNVNVMPLHWPGQGASSYKFRSIGTHLKPQTETLLDC
ncbi:hypothetical protein DFH27DRAFT_635495 [Peziza echinospora]|nr:hypothetical protein DFH27DRAFT_635495 [Peziza echinospora]